MTMPLLSVVAQVSGVGSVRTIDIIVTLLLTLVSALTAYTLRTILRHQDDVTELKLAVWGKDRQNGIMGRMVTIEKDAEDAIERLGRVMGRILRRLDRLEQHNRLPRLKPDDSGDTEDDS